MNNNALRKDIFRTIRKEKKRFFSILMITALGVAMMTGLTAACNDLRWSADALYDEQGLFDIQISSTLGLDEDDIAALSALDEVAVVEGEYSETVYVEVEGVHEEAKVRTLGEEINVPTVIEGTLPKAADEIAVTESYLLDTGKQVGDTLTFTVTETDEDEDPVFADVEYTITAKVLDPFDVNNREGSVSFRASASEEYTFFVPASAADTEIYTAVYLSVEGADALMCYSDEYVQLISDVKTKINSTLKEEQQQNRYDTVYGEALAEYNDALEEVLDELADAQTEIDDGWAELQDGLKELNDGKTELEEQEASAHEQIADGLAQIQSGYESLAEAKKQLDASAQELADGADQLSEGKDELERTKTKTLAQIDDGLSQYEEGIASAKEQRETLIEQQEELTAQKAALESQKAELTAQLEELVEQKEALDEQKEALAAQEEALAVQKEMLTEQGEDTSEVEASLAAVEAGLVEIEAGLEELEAGISQVEADISQLEAGIVQLEDALSQIEEGLSVLEEGLAEAEAGLAALQAQREAAAEQFATAETEIAAQEEILADGQAQYESGLSQWQESKDTLDESQAALEEQAAEAEEQFADAWAEIEENEQKLADAEQELIDGQAELDESTEEAMEELADAKEEIDEIEMTKWYIQSRDSLSGYSNVDSDATAIEGIATFLPFIFFVVAILISLTTITRMVEEDRGLIGTYKALGFKNGEIRRKYVIYDAGACLAGGLVGDFCGFIVLPKIIFTFFRVMYTIPDYLLRFQISSGIASIVLFMAGILAAVCVAVKGELVQVPAALMRPLVPKSGSRIILERIRSIWTRMSFLNKVTARNLFRYKKRLVMTVVGIMGCTGLLICGFAIKNTVTDLMSLQYENVNRYDILAVVQAEDNDTLLSYMEDEENIASYLNLQVETVSIENEEGESESVQIFVFPDDAAISDFIKIADTDGNETALTDDGIFVTHSAADVLGLSVGDTVVIQDLSLNEAEFAVAMVTENYLGDMIYVSESCYETYFDSVYEPNAVLVNLTESCKADDPIAYAKDLGAKDGLLSTTSTESLKAEFSKAFRLINLVVYVILVMAAALAFVVLFTLSTTNISERERELATIKVLGFFDREVHSYVNKETLILTAIGIVLGLPAGRVISMCMCWVLKIPGLYFAVSIHPITYVICAAISFVFALIVNQITNRLLNAIDPVEALKSIE